MSRLGALFREGYYRFKPWLPWRLRVALRRRRATWIRRRCRDSWPIQPKAAERPPNWPGWPGGHHFAVVLTHDVETAAGLAKCRPLLEMERDLGFRSSFNFIPEGDYRISGEMRRWIGEQGFEVGVHDFRHDGKLFRSRHWFRRHASCINRYLQQWDAVGFRSAFMLREMDWLHDLDIRYDASTFDTDPFEPQPDGVHSIYPFWVPGPDGRGYVELPYTLVQDFTLFVILQERGPEIWKRKLDWIAEQGGMALLDTHPDYMTFPGSQPNARAYPVELYQDFLSYLSNRYAGQFWHPLPREMADYVRGTAKHQLVADPARHL